MTPRLMTLFLRSRLTGVAMGAMLGAAALAWFGFWKAESELAVASITILTPVAPAAVLAAGMASPFGEVERTASFPLASLRGTHLVGLLSWAGMTLASAGAGEPTDGLVWLLIRNGAGHAGLALFGAWVLGAQAGWLVAFAYGGAVTVGRLRGPASDAWWSWPMRDVWDWMAWTLALGFLVVGPWFAVRDGARDRSDDDGHALGL